MKSRGKKTALLKQIWMHIFYRKIWAKLGLFDCHVRCKAEANSSVECNLELSSFFPWDKGDGNLSQSALCIRNFFFLSWPSNGTDPQCNTYAGYRTFPYEKYFLFTIRLLFLLPVLWTTAEAFLLYGITHRALQHLVTLPYYLPCKFK